MNPDDLAALEEERAFLRRSLDDLDRELAAGDLDEVDHATLRADYERRLGSVGEAIAAGAMPAAPPRSRGRTLAVVGVVALVAVGAGVAVASNMGARKPGDTITGEVPSTTSELLAEAAALARDGEFVEALETYDRVLEANPDEVEALSEKGLLLLSLANAADRPVLRTQARASLDRALSLDPDNPRVHFYLGLWHDLEGNDEAAEASFQQALANDPPPDLRRAIEGFRETTAGR